MRYGILAAVPVLAIGAAVAREPARGALTFEDRVAAQKAIERVYYSHQIGATKPFEEAVPLAVLEHKVRKYLDESVALQVDWKTSVTDEMLQRELERMAKGTRMPERLLELYAALGNDPFLIKECLARATLVDRLAHNFYAFDRTLHADGRRRAEALHRQLSAGELNPAADHPDRSVGELVMSESKAEKANAGANPFRHQLSQDEFRTQRGQLPAVMGQVSALEEKRDAFVFSVVLSETTREVRVANYLIPKTKWDDWWATSNTAIRGDLPLPVASADEPLPRVTARVSVGAPEACVLDDTWDNRRDDAPETRASHSAVWTGAVIVIWGGRDRGLSLNSGARYDPATDSWIPTSAVAAPSARHSHTAVWSGTVMIVWGGAGSGSAGGRYDPLTDTWTSTSTVAAPSARDGPTAVWTGSVMIVWGGSSPSDDLDTGGTYDPATDAWTPTSTVGAPSGRHGHTALWTGSAMIVWGGANDRYPYFLGTGGLYDPTRDTWTPTATRAAPSPRSGHTSVWAGSEMVVWGGADNGGYRLTGGRYNPGTNRWTDTATDGAPAARSEHTAVWTGLQMVIWAGNDTDGSTNTGGRYDPATNSWTATSTSATPSARSEHTAIWTGTQMVVWGGIDAAGFTATGGRYDPATDNWTPTFTRSGPSGREFPTAVWTGNLVVVWGGYDGATLDTGGRYDPATDNWTPTSTTEAPSARAFHTAIWTGSLMVVWGGAGTNVDFLDTGGRYDPATDVWTPVSTTRAPAARDAHTVVWTGGLMVVWGGRATGLLDTGGRYDPATDIWTPMSTAGAPSARGAHTAVWTGGLMVVWGGFFDDGSSPLILNTGGRYDPTTDSWTPTSMTGVTTARYVHTAVWTGSLMVVWGGAVSGAPFDLNTVGRYEPATDTWVTTPLAGAPSARYGHTAVWTGSQMVIWGGVGLDGYANTGGRYDPSINIWTSTSTTAAPSGRGSHTAVWTGTEMFVWGGLGYASAENTSGRYCVTSCASPATWYSDADGDGYGVSSVALPYCSQPIGYVAVGGDCDGTDPGIHPGATEVCNGVDDDCDAAIDTGGNALCSDANACTTADVCEGVMGCGNKNANLSVAGFSAGRVDGRDLVVLADAWNSCPGDPRYNAAANLDGVPTLPDACVDTTDFHLFMTAFGSSCP